MALNEKATESSCVFFFSPLISSHKVEALNSMENVHETVSVVTFFMRLVCKKFYNFTSSFDSTCFALVEIRCTIILMSNFIIDQIQQIRQERLSNKCTNHDKNYR
ncbi:hypothetical protein T01_3990 [Trichinella spiralis]|uniref:Uncharacterized protein n=1 Tax=Trichinella spiralis TaxID=6334 RepID=A0A0V1BN44_TRISP|nr:hypothetical protein T01_3990 [Trichinella spiralis]